MSTKDAVLRSLVSPIHPLLEEARAVLEREIADPSPAAQDMLDHISRFRGKQVRGALLLLVRAAGAQPPHACKPVNNVFAEHFHRLGAQRGGHRPA